MFGSSFKSIASQAVDSLINGAFRLKLIDLINGKIARYGKITALHKDAEGFHAEVLLHGEKESITVHMGNDFHIAGDGSAIRPGTFTASRIWCQRLLEDFAQHQELPIPEGLARHTLCALRKIITANND